MRSPLLTNDEYYTTLQEVIKYYDKHCVYRVAPDYQPTPFLPKGKMLGSSPGSTNNIYVHMARRLTQNPAMLKKVSKLILNNICVELEDENPKRQLVGVESGSINIMVGVGLEAHECGLDLNTFTVKKKRKGSGLFHYVEGRPNRNPVILLDDTINTGGSLRHAADVAVKELFLPVTEKAFFLYSHSRVESTGKVTYRDVLPGGQLLNIDTISLLCFKDIDMPYSSEKYWFPRDCMTGIRGPGISMDNLD